MLSTIHLWCNSRKNRHLSIFRVALSVCALLTSLIICDVFLLRGWRPSFTQSILPLGKHFSFSRPLTDAQQIKTSLAELCEKTNWRDGLWLSCHSHCGPNEDAACGGLNNARNRVQTCLRLAIDAGAGLVLPKIIGRSETTLRPHDGADEFCASDFWDTRHLADSLKIQCPQLRIRFCGNTTGLGPKIISSGTRHLNDDSHTVGTFEHLVQEDLAQNNVTQINAANPVTIEFWDSMFGWNYSASMEKETIRKDLFSILPYRSDILRMGSEIHTLAKAYAPYIGIHLRGEGDWPGFYGGADVQMEHYMKDLEHFRDTTDEEVNNIYVSCGDQNAIDTFRQKLTPLKYTVHDKWTLLADNLDLNSQIDNLTFDQKGIVEYTTLKSADYFLGPGQSTLSLLIAYARTIDDDGDFFTNFINTNSTPKPPLDREYAGSPLMKGNENTRLLIVDGPDLMDRYP